MKIIASDFDDTLYFNDNIEINRKNIESVNKFITMGNAFCIVTGRNYTSLKKLLNENNILYTYLICEDGAKIFNNMDYCIDTVLLEKSEIEKIIPYLEDNNYEYYLDDGYNQTLYYNDCVKIVVKVSDDILKKKIVKDVKDIARVNVYGSRNHVNIVSSSVNKANAIKKLINMEDLNYNDLYVIGDNENDYEMIESFNGGVVKEHAKILDKLNKDVYDNLCDFIDNLVVYR